MDQKDSFPIKKSVPQKAKVNYFLVIVVGFVAGIFASLITIGAVEGVKYITNNTSSDSQSIADSRSTEKKITLLEESAAVSAAKKVQPSVVSIVATRELETLYQSGDLGGSVDPFDSFFNAPKATPEGQTQTQRVGGGTGFYVSSDGLVLTNKHVIDNDTLDYTVVDYQGNEFKAQVLAKDPVQDIALLKIEGSDFPPVELGDSENLDPGQTVIAIGNSLGEYSNTVTKGVVSGIGRSITAGSRGNATTIDNVIQTDAAINPGNSGGPLVNVEGQVIGINTAIDVSGQLIGFALPINDAKNVVTQVQETGKISRPYIGVRYILITEEIARKNDLKVDYGILVSRGPGRGDLAIIPGGPADKAGIEENDIILELNGKKLTREVTFSKEILTYQVGETLSVKILRNGEEKDLSVILEERES